MYMSFVRSEQQCHTALPRSLPSHYIYQGVTAQRLCVPSRLHRTTRSGLIHPLDLRLHLELQDTSALVLPLSSTTMTRSCHCLIRRVFISELIYIFSFTKLPDIDSKGVHANAMFAFIVQVLKITCFRCSRRE